MRTNLQEQVMREIKFRARTKGQRNNTWAYITGVGHDQWCSPAGRYYGEIDCQTLNQYIGLKDKHGVDIYEGDICARHWHAIPSWKPSTFRVVVENLTCGFYWIPQSQQHPYDAGFQPFWLQEEQEWAYHFDRDIEVIGNIHRNPELLQEDNHERN